MNPIYNQVKQQSSNSNTTEQIAKLKNNPDFIKFCEENKGLTPQQILAKYGLSDQIKTIMNMLGK